MKKILLLSVLAVTCFGTSSCVTVRPQERAVLADPIMQFEGDPIVATQLHHAIDNREGSFGGSGVAGGGCGCN